MKDSRVGFGEFIRYRRQALGISLRGLAAELQIAPPYLSDMENGKRNPPTGNLLEKLKDVLCKNDAELQLYFYDIVGIDRDEVSPDLAEHLKANFASRLLARLIMQVNLHPEKSSDEESYMSEIEKAIERVADQKGIKLVYPKE